MYYHFIAEKNYHWLKKADKKFLNAFGPYMYTYVDMKILFHVLDAL